MANEVHAGSLVTVSVPAPGRYLCFPDVEQGLVVELLADTDHALAGTRGVVTTNGCGTSTYDWHVEVAVDGFGAPIDDVVVVALVDEVVVKTPYVEWCRRHQLVLRCPRCKLDILGSPGICPDRIRKRRDMRARALRTVKLEQRRWAWLGGAGRDVEVPIQPTPRANARELVMVARSLEDGISAARAYCFDFDGVHVVPRDGFFGIWATGFREPADGESHPDGVVESRDWPIPLLGLPDQR